MPNGTRLTLDVTPELDSALTHLAKEWGCTKSLILRHGITFLLAAAEAKKEGFSVGAWKQKDGMVTNEKMFILPG